MNNPNGIIIQVNEREKEKTRYAISLNVLHSGKNAMKYEMRSDVMFSFIDLILSVFRNRSSIFDYMLLFLD